MTPFSYFTQHWHPFSKSVGFRRAFTSYRDEHDALRCAVAVRSGVTKNLAAAASDGEGVSEPKFRRNLTNARVVGTRYDTEGAPVDQAAGSVELRVIEDVEEFKPKFEHLRLSERKILFQGHV